MNDETAITRGHPSYVWRFGQDRRLGLIRQFAALDGRRVLDIGCGIGAYVKQFEQQGAAAFGVDIEQERLRQAGHREPVERRLAQAVSEHLPFACDVFDMALLHEVIEHVRDDRATVAEALRVTHPGGRVIIFAPNRGWPFETHGFFWRGRYHFGNIPLIPYLPDGLRRRLAPHVRTYTRGSLRRLVAGLPGVVVAHTQIYPGYDNLIARRPALGKALRAITYALEGTPLRIGGLSHVMVIEKRET
ncbi:MAG: class I SAM-dependent methyltransferase [Chloroflexi bacterium]|nr:class I SAM-dependent methyltransferase [Chloroflexota bacterium]MBI3733849.1 class I SAM-dependent methyltransferase [Chloroflexota bacterium]